MGQRPRRARPAHGQDYRSLREAMPYRGARSRRGVRRRCRRSGRSRRDSCGRTGRRRARPRRRARDRRSERSSTRASASTRRPPNVNVIPQVIGNATYGGVSIGSAQLDFGTASPSVRTPSCTAGSKSRPVDRRVVLAHGPLEPLGEMPSAAASAEIVCIGAGGARRLVVDRPQQPRLTAGRTAGRRTPEGWLVGPRRRILA